jgi:DNA-binding NtrC family response regulator
METIPENEIQTTTPPTERLAYSVQEAADMLGINYFTMYRLIQRQKIQNVPGVCAANCSCRELNCSNCCKPT